MARPRPIPRPLFQLWALVLLALAWGLALEAALTGGWPVSMLAPLMGRALAGFGAWVMWSVVWMIVVLPVRLFTDFPTLRETLERQGAKSLADAVQKEREELEAARTGTPAEQRRRHLSLAAGGATLSFALFVATLVNLELAPEHVWLEPPLVGAVCALLAGYHALRAVLALGER